MRNAEDEGEDEDEDEDEEEEDEGGEERCGGARVIFGGGVFVGCKGRHAER
jgi:hypothetical protein